MSYACTASFKLTWRSALLMAALPMACAVGVQEPGDGNYSDTGGSGGSAETGGNASGGMVTEAGTSSFPRAGSAPTGGRPNNPFGGTSSTGGRAGGGSGGSKAQGGSASGGAASGGRSSGGSASGGRASGGTGVGGKTSGGTSAGGTGTGGGSTDTCGCKKTVVWKDNSNVSFGPGDCVTVATSKYLYTGTKAQTYANGDCSPVKQMTWCTDSGNDYKFMLCP